MGINSVTLSPLFTAVAILTISCSEAVLLSMLKPSFPQPSQLTALPLKLAVSLAYGNIYFAELFFFSDVALMYVFMVLFMSLARMTFSQRNKAAAPVRSWPLCACVLPSAFYQAVLGMFTILGSILILTQHDGLWPQKGRFAVAPVLRELLRLGLVRKSETVVLNQQHGNSGWPSLAGRFTFLENFTVRPKALFSPSNLLAEQTEQAKMPAFRWYRLLEKLNVQRAQAVKLVDICPRAMIEFWSEPGTKEERTSCIRTKNILSACSRRTRP